MQPCVELECKFGDDIFVCCLFRSDDGEEGIPREVWGTLNLQISQDLTEGLWPEVTQLGGH